MKQSPSTRVHVEATTTIQANTNAHNTSQKQVQHVTLITTLDMTATSHLTIDAAKNQPLIETNEDTKQQQMTGITVTMEKETLITKN